VAETLLSPDFFSGWGIRTVAAGQARYNPLSYHNGSVWPHDNSLIASGLAKYECKELRHEIEALRCAIPLLSDDRHQSDDEMPQWQAPHDPGTGTAGKKFWP
jgi:glycogen debranching enzyme